MDRIQFILLRSETLIKRMQAIRARPGATPGTTDHTFISHRLGHAYVHLDKRAWALGAQRADQQQT